MSGVQFFLPSEGASFDDKAMKSHLDSPSSQFLRPADTASARHVLRKNLRVVHGVDQNNADGNIRVCTEPSPLQTHLKNGDVQKRQSEVQVYFDEAHGVTADDMFQIQQHKAGAFRSEDAELERLASYTAVRGEVQQQYDVRLAPGATKISEITLDSPRSRILYYLNFPKLRAGSKDFATFCEGDTLKDAQKDALKQKFKDIVLMGIQIANHNQEGLSIVTPNAFFSGLNPVEKTNAKILFAQAMAELATDANPTGGFPNFKGLFFNPGDMDAAQAFRVAVEDKTKVIPVCLCPWVDASAPQQWAQTQTPPFRVAEAAMGEALGPAGNAALSHRADFAKEENDARACGGDLEAIFGPQFNATLLKKDQYQSLATLEQRPAATPTTVTRPVETPVATKAEATNVSSERPTFKPAGGYARYYLLRAGAVALSALAGVLSLGLLLLRTPKDKQTTSKEDMKPWFEDDKIFESSTTGLGLFHRLEMEQQLIGRTPSQDELRAAGIKESNLDDAQKYFGKKIPKPQ
jgi:hypothetical protein